MSIVSEETARRIADGLERLAKAVEALQVERFIGGVRHDPLFCGRCGGGGGCHAINCPYGTTGSPRF